MGSAVDRQLACPGAGLGKSRGIEHDTAELALVMTRLQGGRYLAGVGDIEGEVVVVAGFQDHPHLLQTFDNLDAIRPDLQIGAVVSERARRAEHHDVLAIAYRCECVGDTQVRVDAQPGDQVRQVGAASVTAEVVAVVEVSVRRADMADHIGDLMDRVIVEGRQAHAETSLQYFPSSIFSRVTLCRIRSSGSFGISAMPKAMARI
ncbi:Uncharacterised protein [Mycobacteroides abscessus subsp. massiliense]|nr:Uncharacterised protein [Mycobacteroides abscessus subsp. massiliense]